MMERVGAHEEIVVEERGRIAGIGPDASGERRQMDDDVGLHFRKEKLHFVLAPQIAFLTRGRDDRGHPRRLLETLDDMPPYEPIAARKQNLHRAGGSNLSATNTGRTGLMSFAMNRRVILHACSFRKRNAKVPLKLRVNPEDVRKCVDSLGR